MPLSHQLITSFVFVWEVGGEGSVGFRSLMSNQWQVYFQAATESHIVESHKICLWEEIIISHGGVISVIDRRASSTGMMHEYHVCTLCSRPPFFFFSWVFGFCLLLRESQCAHVILSSILVWPNKG